VAAASDPRAPRLISLAHLRLVTAGAGPKLALPPLSGGNPLWGAEPTWLTHLLLFAGDVQFSSPDEPGPDGTVSRAGAAPLDAPVGAGSGTTAGRLGVLKQLVHSAAAAKHAVKFVEWRGLMLTLDGSDLERLRERIALLSSSVDS
jgi:hypothetical protein